MRFLEKLFFCNVFFGLLLSNAFAEESCKKLLDGPVRGMCCLYCMHPDAPGGAEAIGDVLLHSCLKNVALSFVMDGSFGLNQDIILNEMSRITAAGRNLWLHLYIYNGPAQRRWKSRIFNSFAMMDPAIFRVRIKNDPDLRQTFMQETEKIIPILQHAKDLGVTVSLAPAVEDNLDNETFDVALALMKEVIPDDLAPHYVRSPCSDCAQGNEAIIPDNVMREKHTGGRDFTTVKGIVSTDGENFQFAGDRAKKKTKRKGAALKTLEPALKKAGHLKNVFLLWVPKYQDSPPDTTPRSPDSRTYRKPNVKEQKELIKFLRVGL